MAVIKAAHYGETEARLMKDPIVIAMAKGLADVPRKQLVHEGEDGGPRFEFMGRANKEYDERGGKDGGHIGAVAHALLALLDAGVAPSTKVVQFFAARDVPGAEGDYNRAMCSVDIFKGDDEDEARKALIEYMIHEEAGALAKYKGQPRGEWAVNRMAAIFDAVQQFMFAKFDGGKAWEQIAFEADGIRFRLIRVERDA